MLIERIRSIGIETVTNALIAALHGVDGIEHIERVPADDAQEVVRRTGAMRIRMSCVDGYCIR